MTGLDLDQPTSTLSVSIKAPPWSVKGTRFHLHDFALRGHPAATRRSWFPIDKGITDTKHVKGKLYLHRSGHPAIQPEPAILTKNQSKFTLSNNLLKCYKL